MTDTDKLGARAIATGDQYLAAGGDVLKQLIEHAPEPANLVQLACMASNIEDGLSESQTAFTLAMAVALLGELRPGAATS